MRRGNQKIPSKNTCLPTQVRPVTNLRKGGPRRGKKIIEDCKVFLGLGKKKKHTIWVHCREQGGLIG